MHSLRTRVPYICTDCLFKQSAASHDPRYGRRSFRNPAAHCSPPGSSAAAAAVAAEEAKTDHDPDRARLDRPPAEESAMSRRLGQMTEEGLEGSGARAGKMISEAGFSDDLKKKLEARLSNSQFRSENAGAFAEIFMPISAGKGTRDIASAEPWTGTETLSDTALRMLDDAHKPLRMSGRSQSAAANPVDLRPRGQSVERGTRLANARNKTSMYALSQDSGMTDAERESVRRQLKERFSPSARSVPATVQGLQSIASQRIEDAIARGLFKNIPRGKGVNAERDHNADSPFIDTTEYFMNKIIKKQDLTPPWIEKQAEIHRTASGFRSRLRADWKRHAARVIASRGGTLDEQLARAKAYAEAEAVDNPPPRAKKEVMSGIDSRGNLTHVSVEKKIASRDPTSASTIIVKETQASAETAPSVEPETQPPPLPPPASSSNPTSTSTSTSTSTPLGREPEPESEPEPKLAPFRDPAWNSIESTYHTMAIKNLNSLTRSYNLMAPELAKKPYFNLDRELKLCYAQVAPLLPGEILARASAPRAKVEVDVVGHAPGGVLQRFGVGESARVMGDRRKTYGFREFWNDLFGKEEEGTGGGGAR